MTQTTFTDNVLIDGSQDITQLTVEGHSTQTQTLQTWQDSADTPFAKLTGDGRLQVGDFEPAGTMATDDALIEAHRSDTSTKPKRGLHTLGRISGAVSDAVTWAVQELELLGSGGVTSLQTALRGRIAHKNTGTSTTADLRAGDFEATNETGTTGARVGKATGVRAAVRNLTGAFLQQAIGAEIIVENPGTITDAYGVKIADMPSGVSGSRYALYSGAGTAHFGDDLEVPVLPSTPGANPPANFAKLYTKLVTGEPHLFTKDASGTEREISGSATFPNQNANTVFAGPTSGGPAAPAFRALVAVDIPALDAAKITTGVFDNARINWAAPGAIGTSTPATGRFSALEVESTTAATLDVDGAAANWRITRYLTAGTLRWQIGTNNSAEGGSNAGSDFVILRHSDAGAQLATAMAITRSNGNVIFNIDALDSDFLVRGDTDLNLLSVDASQDSIGIGVAAPNASAKFQIDSTTKGLLIPRMTTAQRDAISAPASGLLIYNTTAGHHEYYNGSGWIQLITLTLSETLTNKTLTTPTIGNFTNAQHNHQGASGGGSLDAAAIGSGTLNNARVNWASPGAIGTSTPATGKFSALEVESTTAATLDVDGTAGNWRLARYLTAGSLRWQIGANTGAESGSNAGSDLVVIRHADNGSQIDTPLSITRSNGQVNIFGPLRHSSTTLGFYNNTPVGRQTYGAPTGTATRTTFATGTVTLPQLAERVKAIIDDLRAVGLFA